MAERRKFNADPDCPDCYTHENGRERCPKCIKLLQERLSGCGFKLTTPKHNGRVGGRVVVTVGNRPYAGFQTPEEAVGAAALWSRYWPAAKEYPIQVEGN
jgi:hypothetical protein